MGCVYSSIDNGIIVTGYTSGVPCNFTDLWTADFNSKPTSADKGSIDDSKGLLLESGNGQGNGLAVNDQVMRLAESCGQKVWVFITFPQSDITAPGMTCWTDFTYSDCGHLIDNDEDSLLGAGGAPRYWSVDLGNGNAKTVIKLRIKFYNSSYSGKDFNIQGSNNNIDWTTLDTDQFIQSGDYQEFEFVNVTAYRYYKINFINYWSNDPYLKQLELLEDIIVPNPAGKTVDFHGTDENGNLDENAVAFQDCTGALQPTHLFATSTNVFKTMNTIDLNGLGINADYEIYQERWGVVSKISDSSFAFTSTIRIGDGVTFGWFADINKNIYADTSSFMFISSVAGNAYIRLGDVKDVSQKTGKQGCVLTKKTINPESDNIVSGDNMFLYDSTFRGTDGMVKVALPFANGRMWACGGNMKLVSKPENMDVFSVTITSEGLAAADYATNNFISTGIIKNLFIYGAYYPFKLNSNINGSFDFFNVVARDYNKLFYLRNLSAGGYIFNAIDWDVPEWTFLWENAPMITIYRQYTFNLKVTDVDGNGEGNTVVILYDKDGNTIDQKGFETITSDIPATKGEITEQIVSNGYYCYDDKTEILTENGFKLFKDLINEKVATLNPKTECLEYHKPKQYFEYDYNDEMIEFKGKKFDLLVTPNHKMWTQKRNNKQWVSMEAEKLAQFQTYRFKRNCEWQGKEVKYFTIPERKKEYGKRKKEAIKIKMNDFLFLLGVYLADGCIDGRGIKIAKDIVKNKEKYYYILERLKKLPFHITETKTGFIISFVQLVDYLKQFGKAKTKYIPNEFKQLPKQQLEILFDAMIICDGSEYRKYYTISPQLSDDFQEITLKLGMASTCHWRKPNNKTDNKVCYISISKNHLTPFVNLRKENIKRKKYKGKIYCVEVQNNLVYVRRNGKSIWCGNSQANGQTLQSYSPHTMKLYKYGKQVNKSKFNLSATIDWTLTVYDNNFITEADELIVAGYTCYVINHIAGTITAVENCTLNQGYDYGQYDIKENPQLAIDEIIETADGINFISQYDFIVNAGITVNATNKQLTFTGTKYFLLKSINNFVNFIINGDLHVDIGANAIIEFDNVIVTGNVYNDDVLHTLTINAINGSSVIAGDPGTGNGETNIRNLIDVTLTGLPNNTEVTIVKVSDRSELYHIENSSGDVVYTTSEQGVVVDILIHHIDYNPTMGSLLDYILPSTNTSIPIELINDLIYNNP